MRINKVISVEKQKSRLMEIDFQEIGLDREKIVAIRNGLNMTEIANKYSDAVVKVYFDSYPNFAVYSDYISLSIGRHNPSEKYKIGDILNNVATARLITLLRKSGANLGEAVKEVKTKNTVVKTVVI